MWAVMGHVICNVASKRRCLTSYGWRYHMTPTGKQIEFKCYKIRLRYLGCNNNCRKLIG